MLLLKILSRLPLRILYVFSDFAFYTGFYLLRYRRETVWRNLTHSFPDKTAMGIRKIEIAFYRNLCDYAVETLYLASVKQEELLTRMKFRNPEIIRPYVERGQSVLLFSSHLFNWEWLLASGCLSLPASVDFVYQAQSSNLFNQFLLHGRTRFGGFPIQREFVAKEVMKRRHLVRAIAIVADQFPGLASDKRYWTNFLHQDTAFFQAINQLAIMTQYPAFFSSIRKLKRGYYEVELLPIGQPPYNRDTFHIVDQYAQTTEKAIARQPENWLWSHKRWKRPRPSGE